MSDLSQQLRAGLFSARETGPSCHLYLLLDDACPVSLDNPLHEKQLSQRPIRREMVRVGLEPAAGAPDWRPLLLQFYVAGERGYPDEDLIDFSLENAAERFNSINGAYVAAWIATSMEPAVLAEQLSRRTEVFDSSVGKTRRLPWYQPHRLGFLSSSPSATAVLRGWLKDIPHWWFLDIAGQLRSIDSVNSAPEPAAGKHLGLEDGRAMSRISFARRVLLGVRKADIVLPNHPELALDDLLQSGLALGLTHPEDLVFFALNGLSLSPGWHEHPRAKQLIKTACKECLPLSGLFTELSDHDIAEISHHAASNGDAKNRRSRPGENHV